MLGAIIGDIAGSRFEWNNHKSKDFELMTYRCSVTDDSVMTLAVAKAIMQSRQNQTDLAKEATACMRRYGRRYPDAGYGGKFTRWIHHPYPKPYNSFGNGAPMRVSPCAYAAKTMEEALELADKVTAVTHNHPEGMKGAEAVTAAIFMALHGKSIPEIRDHINRHYYPMDFTLASFRDTYRFDVTCQGSVPQAIMAFLESEDFEDAVRNAVSLGGDSDTQAAIAGSIAEAYYGIPSDIRELALTFLNAEMRGIVNRFEDRYGIPCLKEQGESDAAT